MQSIRRLYVTKKGPFAQDAQRMLNDLKKNLLISGLTDVKIFNRYDVGGLDDAAFEAAKNMIFSEPPVDAYTMNCRPVKTIRYWQSNICRGSMTSVPIRRCNACRCSL